MAFRSFSRRHRSQLLVGILISASTAGVFGTQALADGPVTWWVATTGTAADPASAGSSCADPSYVGDDDEALQAAVDGASSGDTIRICDGVWLFDTTVSVPKALTIEGNGAADSVLDGGGDVRILLVDAGLTVSVSGLQFQNGYAAGDGQQGGAINTGANSTLNVTDSVFLNNAADHHGGALDVNGTSPGTINVDHSSFIGNSGEDGGAIDLAFASGVINNSTFVENSAIGSGGAVYGDFGVTTINNSTFVNNEAGNNGEAVYVVSINESLIALDRETESLCERSIVNGNVATEADCMDDGVEPVTYESLDLAFVAPWGGATPTVSIGAESSAIGAVAEVDCPAEDQRGEGRSGGDCDAGSFEFVSSPPSLDPEQVTVGILDGIAVDSWDPFVSSGLTEPEFRVATEVSRTLPDGVSIDTEDGTISGTPESSYSENTFVVTAEDASGNVASALVTIDNCVLTTVDGVYQITNRSDLEIFRRGFCGLDSDYQQTADIEWDDEWASPTSNSDRFTGTYDGGGNAISGLEIIDGGEYASFLSHTEGATISDLYLDVDFSGDYGSAGLVGWASESTISNVHVEGVVSDTFSDPVSGGCLGGLAGETSEGTSISESSFVGDIDGADVSWNGGLIGCAYEQSILTASLFDGNVSGWDDVGGLIGWMAQSEISDSYALGSVVGNSRDLGGLIGWFDSDSDDDDDINVYDSYASTSIEGVDLVGGIAGFGDLGTFSAAFWEGGLDGADDVDVLGGVDGGGETPGEMATDPSSMRSFAFFDDAGWAIANGWEDPATSENVWGICDGEGTPFLLWEYTESPCGASGEEADSRSTGAGRGGASESGDDVPTTVTPTPGTVPMPEVAPGATSAYIDGQVVDANIDWSDASTVVGQIGEVSLSASFGSTGSTNGSDGVITPGSSASIRLGGLQPNSEVTATIFSTPVSLGRFTVGADGRLATSLTIPSGIEAGAHRIRLEATDAAGRAIAVWLGVTVRSVPLVLPKTGSGLETPALVAWWLIVAGLALTTLRRRSASERFKSSQE